MNEKLLDKHIKPLLEKGYQKELGISEEEFLDLIPEPPEKQDGYGLLLVIPDRMIKLKRQIELSGITLNVNAEKIKNVSDGTKKPYWILFRDGSANRGKSPSECMQSLKRNERGLNVIEGVSLFLQYPQSVHDHSIDMIGSSYGNECTPTIYKWNNKVMISAICSDVADSMCGAATCLKRQSHPLN